MNSCLSSLKSGTDKACPKAGSAYANAVTARAATTAVYAARAAVDGAGNAYITGYTRSSLMAEPNAGGTDAFLATYDTSGTPLWTRQTGTAALDHSYGVAVYGACSHIIGYTDGSLGGPNAGLNDVFLAKYTSPADINQDCVVTSQDFFDFLAAFFTDPPTPAADFNHDGSTTSQDFFDFIAAFFIGCP